MALRHKEYTVVKLGNEVALITLRLNYWWIG